ncbi:LuxR C-terminal-related transcriptional regulator [Demequina rhizosphaerae]|uniref:LuxR C-terminal-related transcriptional regulator n=1 Tax=Demequina rhizosphaerae TaxID=1638985 RepID=UPI00078473E2|nr:response regulator transcription factor [Demequina rhizosphaerae]
MSESPVRVAVLAVVRLYRDSLCSFLAETDGVELVAAMTATDDAIDAVGLAQPDVILLDVPSEVRVQSIRRVLDAIAAVRIVAVGVPEREEAVLDLARAGATGYVSDQASQRDLVLAVRAAAKDELYCSPRIAAALLRRACDLPNGARRERAPALTDSLTAREDEVLELIRSGLSNQQIARRLHIALPTVKNHVHSILHKLHARNRTEALVRAVDRGPMRESLAPRWD